MAIVIRDALALRQTYIVIFASKLRPIIDATTSSCQKF
jgi:hypothetical protein